MKRRILAITPAILAMFTMTACGQTQKEDMLRVAMECAYAPYNWTQGDNSNGAVAISGTEDYAYGYDVMMAKKIADHLGKELEIVKLD